MTKLKLHSNDKAAAEATDQTIKNIPNAFACLNRGEDGEISFDQNGYATLLTTNLAFSLFAIKNQGYVAAVIE